MMSVIGQKALGFLTFFILARFLTPADYGVFAVVTLVVATVSQITTFSFGDALMQRQGDVEKFLDPIWTFDLLRNFVIGAAFAASANAIAAFFHLTDPSVVLLIRVSGLLLVVNSFSSIRQIHLSRDLHFRKLFIRDILGQIAYTAATIALVLTTKPSAWILFWGLLAQNIVTLIASYVLAPGAPRLSFHFERLKELWGFTKWVYGQEVLDVILAQVDKFVVGRLVLSADLGIYSKAKDMASTATATVGSMFTKVGLPAFAKIQEEMGKVRQGFLKSCDIVLISSVPFAVLVALEGGALVQLLLGQSWLALVVPLKIFAFGNVFLSFAGAIQPILSAMGRPDVNFRSNFIKGGLTVAFLAVGYRLNGLFGLTWGVAAAWIVIFFYLTIVAWKLIELRWRDLRPVVIPGAAACAAAVAADMGWRIVMPHDAFGPTGLLGVAISGVAYALGLFATSRYLGEGSWRTLQSIITEIIPKKAPTSWQPTPEIHE